METFFQIKFFTTMNIDEIAFYIDDFYNTSDENRRKQVSLALNNLQEEKNWWQIALSLVDSRFSEVVQFYGAKGLSDVLNKKFDLISENADNTNNVRRFYVEKLSSRITDLSDLASVSPALFNILTSGLAVLLLKSLPDIWPNPFVDLTSVWGDQRELLVRVLTEVAAEFPRISTSLKQRNVLRTELLRISPDIAQMANCVLADSNSSSSLRSAAIECVELWLKLPGVKISDFLIVFNLIFDNIATATNKMTLTRILSTLKANEELRLMPKLIIQFTQFIVNCAARIVTKEIDSSMVNLDVEIEDEMGDVIPLICAITDFSQTFLRQIVGSVIDAVEGNESYTLEIYNSLCAFFAQISTLKGTYPVDECVSDLPEMFWSSLSEELSVFDASSTASPRRETCRATLRYATTHFFLEILQSAIDKIAVSPSAIRKCDKFQLERFHSYRLTRSDVSKNAIEVAPLETLNLLGTALDNYLNVQDIDRSEAVLFYFIEGSYFLKKEHVRPVVSLLLRCSAVTRWSKVSPEQLVRFGKTLMEFLARIEHHLMASGGDSLTSIVKIILDFMRIEPVSPFAIETLTTFLENREPILQPLLETIIQDCYALFGAETRADELRLRAIRCMGTALSMKESSFILNSLDHFLMPRLISLKEMIGINCTLSPAESERKILFELGVLARLIETLEIKNTQGNLLEEKIEDNLTNSMSESSSVASPVRLIMEQCLPFFEIIFSDSRAFSSQELVTKVCDVLRASLISLHTFAESFLDTYLKYLDTFLFSFSAPAVELAKMLFLTFRSADPSLLTKLFTRLSDWHVSSLNSVSAERSEQFLNLDNYVLKKCWHSMEQVAKFPGDSEHHIEITLQSMAFSAVQIIQQSRDLTLMQESFRLLQIIIKNASASDVAAIRRALEAISTPVISVAFLGTQSELCTTFLATIAEILFNYARLFPDMTKAVAMSLPGSEPRLAETMFASPISLRNFRTRVMQINQAAAKRSA